MTNDLRTNLEALAVEWETDAIEWDGLALTALRSTSLTEVYCSRLAKSQTLQSCADQLRKVLNESK